MPRVVLKKERCIFTLILLVPLIIAVVSSDIVTVGAWVVAIFFVWLVPLRLDVSSSHHRSMVVLIENELKKSENPSNEFYTIFDRLVKKNELQKEEMLEILSYFSSREDDVGVAARRLRNGILS